MLFKRNKEMIHFSGRRHTKTGIFSTVTGIVAVVGTGLLCIISSVSHGRGGLILGVAGISLFALSVFGFVLSYKAFKKKDIFFRFPIIGAILNGFMIILLLIMYIWGIIV